MLDESTIILITYDGSFDTESRLGVQKVLDTSTII